MWLAIGSHETVLVFTGYYHLSSAEVHRWRHRLPLWWSWWCPSSGSAPQGWGRSWAAWGRTAARACVRCSPAVFERSIRWGWWRTPASAQRLLLAWPPADPRWWFSGRLHPPPRGSQSDSCSAPAKTRNATFTPKSKLWFIKKYILRTKSAFIWSKIQY